MQTTPHVIESNETELPSMHHAQQNKLHIAKKRMVKFQKGFITKVSRRKC